MPLPGDNKENQVMQEVSCLSVSFPDTDPEFRAEIRYLNDFAGRHITELCRPARTLMKQILQEQFPEENIGDNNFMNYLRINGKAGAKIFSSGASNPETLPLLFLYLSARNGVVRQEDGHTEPVSLLGNDAFMSFQRKLSYIIKEKEMKEEILQQIRNGLRNNRDFTEELDGTFDRFEAEAKEITTHWNPQEVMSKKFLNGMAEQKDLMKEHYVPDAAGGNTLWTEKNAQCAVEQLYYIEMLKADCEEIRRDRIEDAQKKAAEHASAGNNNAPVPDEFDIEEEEVRKFKASPEGKVYKNAIDLQESVIQAIEKKVYPDSRNVVQMMSFYCALDKFTKQKSIECGKEVQTLTRLFMEQNPEQDRETAEMKAIRTVKERSRTIDLLAKAVFADLSTMNHDDGYSGFMPQKNINADLVQQKALLREDMTGYSEEECRLKAIGDRTLPAYQEPDHAKARKMKHLSFSREEQEIIERYAEQQNTEAERVWKLQQLTDQLKKTNGVHVNSDKYDNLTKALKALTETSLSTKSYQEKLDDVSACAEEYLKNKYKNRKGDRAEKRYQTALEILRAVDPEKESRMLERLNAKREANGYQASKEFLTLQASQELPEDRTEENRDRLISLQQELRDHVSRGVFGRKKNSKEYQAVLDKLNQMDLQENPTAEMKKQYFKELAAVCRTYLAPKNPDSDNQRERFKMVTQVMKLAEREEKHILFDERVEKNYTKQKAGLEELLRREEGSGQKKEQKPEQKVIRISRDELAGTENKKTVPQRKESDAGMGKRETAERSKSF